MTDERLNEIEAGFKEAKFWFQEKDLAAELIGALRAANTRIAQLQSDNKDDRVRLNQCLENLAQRAFDHEFDIRSFNELAENQSAKIAALEKALDKLRTETTFRGHDEQR